MGDGRALDAPHTCPECGRGVRLRYSDNGGVFARHKPGPGGVIGGFEYRAKADLLGWCQGSGRFPGDDRPRGTSHG